MAETLVNKTQAGEGIWHQDNLVAGSGISIQQVPQPVIDEHTIELYHFDDNLKETINNTTRTSTSSYFSYSDGKFDKAIYTGGKSFGWSTSGTHYNSSSQSFTFDFWIKAGQFSESYKPTICLGASGDYYIELWNNYLLVSNDMAGTSSDKQFTIDFTVNTWAHIAYVHDLVTNKDYVFFNGSLLGSWTRTNNYAYFAFTLVGRYIYLDEFRCSDIARWTSDFTPFTVPYSASAGPAQYAINNTKEGPDLSNYATQSDISGMLKNTATGTDSLTIKGIASSRTYDTNIGVSSIISGSGGYGTAVGYGATGYTGSVVIGAQAQATDANSVTIGRNAVTNSQSVAIGGTANYSTATTASGAYSIAVGYNAKATATNAIQLGSGTNSTASTFKVFNTTVVDANGKVPMSSTDVTSLTGYDATKTQVLKNVQGTLTWVDEA